LVSVLSWILLVLSVYRLFVRPRELEYVLL